MHIADPPKRRWYQYSLRTVFIVITLLAIPCWYVGEQYRIVAHREEVRNTFWGIPADSDAPQPNFIRRWFGDYSITKIFLLEGTKPTDIQKITDAFPEAEIFHFTL